MSFNDTDTVSLSSCPKKLEPIIHPSLNSLVMSHTFLILLFPLTLSLFHLSSPQSRRRPIFLLNVAAIVFAFVMGTLIDVSAIRTILNPLSEPPLELGIIIGFVGVWQSILVDVILLVRLISVYPPRHIGTSRFALLVALPIMLKLTRVLNILLFTIVTVNAANGPNAASMTAFVFEKKPYLKIEWGAQMVDNAYVSVAFLWKIRDRGIKRVVTSSNNVTIAQRMHTLSRIALTNFVVPTIFSIAQFISVYRGISQQVLDQLLLINLMLATFGVAFATLWASNIGQYGPHMSDSKRSNMTSRLVLGVEPESKSMPHPQSPHHPLAVVTTSSGNAANNKRDSKPSE